MVLTPIVIRHPINQSICRIASVMYNDPKSFRHAVRERRSEEQSVLSPSVTAAAGVVSLYKRRLSPTVAGSEVCQCVSEWSALNIDVPTP